MTPNDRVDNIYVRLWKERAAGRDLRIFDMSQGVREMTPTDLRARRAALGMSQRELAEALGISKSTVAHWEQGKQKIPPYVGLALQALERRQ